MFVFLNENLLLEATSKYIKKIFDPALLTFKEFSSSINKQDAWHPHSAYQYSLNNDMENIRYADYETLINRIKKNGLFFELRMNTEGGLKYGKKDEEGEYIRDKNGRVVLLTAEEIKLLGLPTEEYSFAIFDENKQAIGLAQLEWNATLIAVVKEYKNWGFGNILMDVFESKYPGNDSGGFTPEGISFLKNYHSKKVREYLASGFYSYLIKQGHISKEKVKKIISNLTEKKKKTNDLDLDFNRNEDLMLMRYADTDYILYNKKAYDFYQTELENRFDFLKERLIKAHFRLFYYDHGGDILSRIQFFEYDNEGYKNIMQSALIYEVLKKGLELKKDDMFKKAYGGINKKELMVSQIPQMVNQEKTYRKKHDKYQEIEHRIVEMAYSKYNNS